MMYDDTAEVTRIQIHRQTLRELVSTIVLLILMYLSCEKSVLLFYVKLRIFSFLISPNNDFSHIDSLFEAYIHTLVKYYVLSIQHIFIHQVYT